MTSGFGLTFDYRDNGIEFSFIVSFNKTTLAVCVLNTDGSA